LSIPNLKSKIFGRRRRQEEEEAGRGAGGSVLVVSGD